MTFALGLVIGLVVGFLLGALLIFILALQDPALLRRNYAARK